MQIKLRNLELIKLEIPFNVAFKHSSASRSVTETVIVVATSENSEKGYGEGCPRGYVTGEDFESANKFFNLYREQVLSITDILSLKIWVNDNRSLIDENPAIWCAIETALLDLFGKIQGKSIEAILGLQELNGFFQYSAVLGISDSKTFGALLTRYLQLGFYDYKLKVSGNFEIDKNNIETIEKCLPNVSIRIDANNLWQDPSIAIEYLSSLRHDFWAIEEPLISSSYADLEKVAVALNCQIILDESFIKIQQLDLLKENPLTWIPNIRISKMGGLIRSLAIAEKCREQKIEFIIGAQVGETSILTRLALSLANSFREILLAQEGAFGTYLLSRDLVKSPLMFGKNGILAAPEAECAGLGLVCRL